MQKLKDEAKAKDGKAAVKHIAIVRKAAVEHLRLQFGKKPTPTPPALAERLWKACNCHKTMAPGSGLHKDNVHSTRYTSKESCNDTNRAEML